jgi:hypothetical protein
MNNHPVLTEHDLSFSCRENGIDFDFDFDFDQLPEKIAMPARPHADTRHLNYIHSRKYSEE